MQRRVQRVLIVVLLLAVSPIVRAPDTTASAPTPQAWDLVGMVNRERFHHGLDALAVLPAILSLSDKQALAIADQGRLFHNDALAADVGARVQGWTRVGENVGYGATAAAIHAALMASPPHRANILGAFRYIAVSVVARGDRLWVAQVFLDAPPGLPVLTRIPVTRVPAASNVESSIAASRATFGNASSAAVVVAREDLFADSLAGGALAAVNRGPVLLSSPKAAAPALVAEARRVLRADGRVYLMGGPGALAPAVEDAFRAGGLATTRIAGGNRFETAALVAPMINPSPTTILVTSGLVFADAMSVTPAAAKLKAPIILASGNTLPPESLVYLARQPAAKRVVIGGAASVGETAMVAALATERVAGADRYATSTAIAGRWFGDSAELVFATASTFQDAAVAGGVAAGLGAPTILTAAPPTGSTYDFVRERLVRLRGARVIASPEEIPMSTILLLLA